MEAHEELRRIANRHNGILRPADVVEAARPDDHPLHGCFTWDDSEAAEQYRLWQARELIRVAVIVLPGKDRKPVEVRAFVSLAPDREKDGGGYRSTEKVLTDDGMRALLLADAIKELNRIRAKYGVLRELAGVFSELDKVA